MTPTYTWIIIIIIIIIINYDHKIMRYCKLDIACQVVEIAVFYM